MSTPALDRLVAAVEDVLDDPSLPDERARALALRGAMAQLLGAKEPLPAWAEEPLDGGAVGNLVHADPERRFHVLAVVFPEGTSSGVHHHGCWGVIGYLRGGDEETRYRWDGHRPVEVSRHVWHQGDVTFLLPDDEPGDPIGSTARTGSTGCWHRVRNPGPGAGVSVHVLCRTPVDHPHAFWDRDTGRVLDFPFEEASPGRWVARVMGR